MENFNDGDSGEFNLMQIDNDEKPKNNEKGVNENVDQYLLSKEEIIPYSPEMLDLLIEKDSKLSNISKNDENKNDEEEKENIVKEDENEENEALENKKNDENNDNYEISLENIIQDKNKSNYDDNEKNNDNDDDEKKEDKNYK